jgi:citrate lyase subunit gamma (acyl carrier protein)
MSQKIEPAHAGTLESSDAFVRVMPSESEGIAIELESSVAEIYGEAIEALVLQTVQAMKVNNVKLVIQDKGALDYVIKARVQTALLRATGSNEPDWSTL